MHRDALPRQVQDSEVGYQRQGVTPEFHDCRLTAHTIPSYTLQMFSATFLNNRSFFQTFGTSATRPALLDLRFLLAVLLLEYTANMFFTCLSTISSFEDLHSSHQLSVRYSRHSSNEALQSLITFVKLFCVSSSIIPFSC